MNYTLQLFPNRTAWVNTPVKCSIDDVNNFYQGINIDQFLKVIDFKSGVDFTEKQAMKAYHNNPQEFIGRPHLLLYMDKNDKRTMVDFIKQGVSSLSKTPMDHNDFMQLPNIDMETLILSVDKGKYGLVKSSLPVYTCCFIGPGRKTKDNVIGHTGLISLDIDSVITPQQRSAIEKLQPYSIMPSTGGSPRPTFRIAITDKLIKKFGGLSELHEAYFTFFEQTLLNIGVQIDKSCKNINRLFYITPNTTFHHYIDEEAPEIILPKTITPPSKTLKSIKGFNIFDTYESKEDVDITDELVVLIENELSELYQICLDNSYQPFFDGSNMYSSVRDFAFSMKDVLGEDKLTKWLCKFLSLSSIDERLKGTQYENRGYSYIKNEILKK